MNTICVEYCVTIYHIRGELTTGAAGKLDGGNASTGMESTRDVPLRPSAARTNFRPGAGVPAFRGNCVTQAAARQPASSYPAFSFSTTMARAKNPCSQRICLCRRLLGNGATTRVPPADDSLELALKPSPPHVTVAMFG